MKVVAAPSLRHLARLTDDVGIIEHACLDEPCADLGYCTDDAGRLLAVCCALPTDPDARRLATAATSFLTGAYEGGGQFRLRMRSGRWTSDPPSDDANGRALYGLGVAAASAPWPEIRRSARVLFVEASVMRSTHVRATAYAVHGAAAMLRALPDDDDARALVLAAADTLPRPVPDTAWPWPTRRLTYANALLPAALLLVAEISGSPEDRSSALDLLEWLVESETVDGHFSFTPVAGRSVGDPKPAFDQQPIEAWAMADACALAYSVTGDEAWLDAVDRAAAWFLGDNDVGVLVWDPSTDGGFDGLQHDGVNRNQGAESTLAFVATMLDLRAARQDAQAASWSAPSRSSRR